MVSGVIPSILKMDVGATKGSEPNSDNCVIVVGSSISYAISHYSALERRRTLLLLDEYHRSSVRLLPYLSENSGDVYLLFVVT